MKKRNLKSLKLNKNSISNLDVKQDNLKGGIDNTNPLICSAQCSVKPAYCNTVLSCPVVGICL